jgi:hypothetical protein
MLFVDAFAGSAAVSAAQGLKIKASSYFILYTGVFPLETWSFSL